MKMKIALGIIVLAIIGAGWYALSHPHAPVTSNQTATSTPEVSVATSTAPLDTVDWSTCRNETYGYEFKYPKGWYVYRSDTSTRNGYVITSSCNVDTRIVVSKQAFIHGGFYPPNINVLSEADGIWKVWMQQRGFTLNQRGVPFKTWTGKLEGNDVTYFYSPGEARVAISNGGQDIVFTSIGDTGGASLSALSLDNRPEQQILNTILSTFLLIK